MYFLCFHKVANVLDSLAGKETGLTSVILLCLPLISYQKWLIEEKQWNEKRTNIGQSCIISISVSLRPGNCSSQWGFLLTLQSEEQVAGGQRLQGQCARDLFPQDPAYFLLALSLPRWCAAPLRASAVYCDKLSHLDQTTSWGSLQWPEQIVWACVIVGRSHAWRNYYYYSLITVNHFKKKKSFNCNGASNNSSNRIVQQIAHRKMIFHNLRTARVLKYHLTTTWASLAANTSRDCFEFLYGSFKPWAAIYFFPKDKSHADLEMGVWLHKGRQIKKLWKFL